MVAIIRVATIHDEHPEMSVRALKRVAREVYGAVGRKWIKDLMPDHFKVGAHAVFGYASRRAATLAKKRKLAAIGFVEEGGTRDLVHSGRLRRMLLAINPDEAVTAYPTRATVDLKGPPYFRINYKPGRPNLGEEVTRMSQRHLNIIDATAESVYDRALAKEQRRKTVRTK